MLVYTIEKGTNKSFVYDIYHGIQGEQGIQGIQGETGPQGPDGRAATVSVGSVTSGTVPSVINVGTSNAAILDFVLEKGDKGDQGPVGQSAGFGTPTASVTTLAPSTSATVAVTASGDATQKVFDFSFGIPAGVQGEQGIQGPIGPTGTAAGFGTPAISVTSLPAGSTPTASIAASGPDTAKVFDFSLGIPTGSDSWFFTIGPFISNQLSISCSKNGLLYTGSISLGFSVYDSQWLRQSSVIVGNIQFYTGSGSVSFDSTQMGYLNNTNVSYIQFTFRKIENNECIGTILYSRKAGSIASGEKGFVTGEQVYTEIGNINTILQSI